MTQVGRPQPYSQLPPRGSGLQPPVLRTDRREHVHPLLLGEEQTTHLSHVFKTDSDFLA